MSKDRRDISGQKFGHLIVLHRGDDYIVPSIKRNYPCWMVKCRCGHIFRVRESSLMNGDTTSCGRCITNVINGIADRKIAQAAYGVIDRCTRSDRHDWNVYGGRGIKNELGVDAFEVYMSLKRIPGYFLGAQLDRIDTNGNYTLWHNKHQYDVYYDEFGHSCVGNLRWVTPQFNSLNKRNGLKLNKISVALTPRTKIQLIRGMQKLTVRDLLGDVTNYHFFNLDKMRYRTKSGKNNGYKDECVYIAIHYKIINKCPRLYKKIMENINHLQVHRKFIDERWNELYLPLLLPKIIIL